MTLLKNLIVGFAPSLAMTATPAASVKINLGKHSPKELAPNDVYSEWPQRVESRHNAERKLLKHELGREPPVCFRPQSDR